DERRHGVGLDLDADAFLGEEVAVVDVEVVYFDALGHLRDPSSSVGKRDAAQRPDSLGANTLAIRRPARLSTITIRMSVSAAAQARSMYASAGRPGYFACM